MRKLQKLAALGLAGSMALSLVACGGSAASGSKAAADSTPPRFRRGYCREHCFRRRGRHPELGPVG